MIDMYSPTKLPGQAEAFEGRPILTEHYHEIVPADSEGESEEEQLGVAARLSRKLLQKEATAREDAAGETQKGAASAGRGSQLSSLQPGKKT